jgi:hypothetical protein
MRKSPARDSNKSHTARVKLCIYKATRRIVEQLRYSIKHIWYIFYYYLSIIELLTTTTIYRRVQHNTCSIVTLAKSSTVSLSDFSLVHVPPVLLSQNLYWLIFNYLDEHHLLATFHKENNLYYVNEGVKHKRTTTQEWPSESITFRWWWCRPRAL